MKFVSNIAKASLSRIKMEIRRESVRGARERE